MSPSQALSPANLVIPGEEGRTHDTLEEMLAYAHYP